MQCNLLNTVQIRDFCLFSYRYFDQGAIDIYNCPMVAITNSQFSHNRATTIVKPYRFQGQSAALSIGRWKKCSLAVLCVGAWSRLEETLRVRVSGNSTEVSYLHVCTCSLPPTPRQSWSWSVFHLVSSCGEGAMSCLTHTVLNGHFSSGESPSPLLQWCPGSGLVVWMSG